MTTATEKLRSEHRKLSTRYALRRVGHQEMIKALEDLIRRHGDVLRNGHVTVLDTAQHKQFGEQLKTQLDNLKGRHETPTKTDVAAHP